MDFVAFKARYAAARPFVDMYEDKQFLIQAQLAYRDSIHCEPGERVVLDEWLTINGKWLVDNEEKYNQANTLLALPKENIDDLYKAYEALCGGTDGNITGV